MSDALKVVMLTTSYPRWEGDAAGHFVASLAEELASFGHAVTVIAPHEPSLAVEESVRGVSLVRFRYAPDRFERLAYGDGIVPNVRRRPWLPVVVPGFAHAMRRTLAGNGSDADVIHAHWAPTAALAAPRHMSAAVALTLHGSDTSLAARGRLWRAFLNRGLANADALSVVALPQVSIVKESGFTGPVRMIPNGVPVELTSRRRSTGDGRAKVIYVGRMIESKGVLDLLEAFISVAGDIPHADLVFVGAGNLLEAARGRAAESGLGDRIAFTGGVTHDAALDLTAEASLLVLPSYAEGSPLSVTEALALGTPVLGTAVGAVPDLVADSGEIVTPGDRAALAAALVGLLSDPESTRACGIAARARIARELTWPAVARETELLYREAIERRAARP